MIKHTKFAEQVLSEIRKILPLATCLMDLWLPEFLEQANYLFELRFSLKIPKKNYTKVHIHRNR